MRRVLVVDDNTAIHDDFRKVLAGSLRASPKNAALDDLARELLGNDAPASTSQTPSFEVHFAAQGQAAVEMVRASVSTQTRYPLAFVDMRMPPGMNGVETAQALWEADHALQIVICTAYSDFSWRDVMARLARPDDLHLLRKPFKIDQVRQMAEVLVSRWTRLRAVP